MEAERGINEHLPNPRFFDHVMVQADIGDKIYWLDGTRTGDLRMRAAPPDFYKWVLPLTAAGTDISPVRFVPLDVPEEISVINVDARAGYDKPAKFTFQRIIRGDDALVMRAALASLPASEAESQLKQMFGSGDVESARWKFDADSAALVLSVITTQMMDWDKASGDTRWSNSIPGAGFYPPPRRKRSGQQDARAPWTNDPHSFSCHVTTMQLPKAEPGWIWTHNSAMDHVIGGVALAHGNLTEGTMRTVMAKRTLRDEISPEEAEVANNQIPGFNNNQSQVYQVQGAGGWSELEVADASIKEVPTATGHDWVMDSSPCIAPRLRNGTSAQASGQAQGQRLFVAGGEVNVTVPPTPQMIVALQKDPAFRQIFGGQTPPEGSIFVSPAQLRESSSRDFIVVGRTGLPGVASGQIPFWLLLQTGDSFNAIHNFLGQELEIKSTWTAGYADLELRAPSPRGDKFIVSLKYDPATQKYSSGLPRIRDEDIPALFRGRGPQNP